MYSTHVGQKSERTLDLILRDQYQDSKNASDWLIANPAGVICFMSITKVTIENLV